MLGEMRGKSGQIVIGVIVALICFVFIFSGVFYNASGIGGGPGVMGVVNGEQITANEVNRLVNQRLSFARQYGAKEFSEEQIAGVRKRVFEEVIDRKLAVQEAEKLGMLPSDEQVRARIREYPAFQEEGRFDPLKYKEVLKQNRFTASAFEEGLRNDLTLQNWSEFFKKRVRVSEAELRRSFLDTNEKRVLRYVVLNSQTGRRGVQVTDKDVSEYLKDASKLNLVKAQFEAKKAKEFKGKSFDQAKKQIAKDLVAAGKSTEIDKVNDNLAKKVETLLSKNTSSEQKVNRLLKPYGAKVRKSSDLTITSRYLSGVGSVKTILKDAFAPKSPLQGRAKVYRQAGSVVVATLAQVKNADLSQFDSEKKNLRRRLLFQKQREQYAAWRDELRKRAEILRK